MHMLLMVLLMKTCCGSGSGAGAGVVDGDGDGDGDGCGGTCGDSHISKSASSWQESKSTSVTSQHPPTLFVTTAVHGMAEVPHAAMHATAVMPSAGA